MDLFVDREQSLVIDRVFDLPESWQRPDASWRRMHLSEPPMVFVQLSIEVNEGDKVLWSEEFDYFAECGCLLWTFYDEEVERDHCTYRYVDVSNPKGVTAGEIFDAFKREFWSTPAEEGSRITVEMFGRTRPREKMWHFF